ncbi:MAG: hypothetical protein ABIP20_10170 [Chthoniobacteraceae bacterium]
MEETPEALTRNLHKLDRMDEGLRRVPVVSVSAVALRLHRAVRMMEDFPASACDTAWLRVHSHLSAFRTEMLWLNDNYHLAPPPDGLEVDVTECLQRLRAKGKKRRKSKTPEVATGINSYVCHIKSNGTDGEKGSSARLSPRLRA